MIHFISEGGLVKRYVCDSADEVVNFPQVAAGSTVQVITTGDVFTINEEGEWKLTSSLPAGGGAGTPGQDGKTPVKGEDYFTEEDKKEFIQEILDSKPLKPVYDEEKNYVFCNGAGVIISDNGEKNVISYYLDVSGTETLEVPYGCEIYGGGDGSIQPINIPSSSIIVNGGKFKAICGGGRGGCHVGSVSLVVNGGEFKEGVFGGGSNNAITNDKAGNSVGNVFMTINNISGENGQKVPMVYGGGATGLCHAGHVTMEINGGAIKFLVPSGSNGQTGSSTLTINGGDHEVVQPVGNGSIGNAKIILKEGTVDRLYGGGIANTVVGKTVLKLLGGQVVTKIGAGSSNDKTANHISGCFIDGVIPENYEETALNMNLKNLGEKSEIFTQWASLE